LQSEDAVEKLAELIEGGMRRKGWSLNRLSVEVGVLPSGRIVAPSQIRRLRLGEQQDISKELLDRLIELLDLDADEAYEAADRWPLGVDSRMLQDLREKMTAEMDQRIVAGPSHAARQAERRRSKHTRKNPPDIGTNTAYSLPAGQRDAQLPRLFAIAGEAA
jgi:transcriptional regulator with XRE-family HTH domain